ncbi:MAG: sugar phosphate isomerase/epimerase [Oscillospiraceae bacterium]|nr:sugar phosphate isomerase/epimerase [Oscillospiraceae bacterium]
MADFKIGIMTESFKLPLEQSLKKARELCVDGVQLNAASRELPVDEVTPGRIKEVRAMLDSYGLEVSAVCGDFGGHGFCVEADNPARIERSKRAVDMTLELGGKIITTHIGVVPPDQNSKRFSVVRDACNKLAEYAHKSGAFFAIETGPEPSEVLALLLDSLDSKGVGVNMDPANLVMVIGEDPVKAVHNLKDYIVHTHAKDGVMRKLCDPQAVYDFFAEGGIEDMRLSDYFLEVPLGQGDVDFPAYLAALGEIGFGGFLTVEREVGGTPEADIKLAVEFLRGLV